MVKLDPMQTFLKPPREFGVGVVRQTKRSDGQTVTINPRNGRSVSIVVSPEVWPRRLLLQKKCRSQRCTHMQENSVRRVSASLFSFGINNLQVIFCDCVLLTSTHNPILMGNKCESTRIHTRVSRDLDLPKAVRAKTHSLHSCCLTSVRLVHGNCVALKRFRNCLHSRSVVPVVILIEYSVIKQRYSL